MKRALRIGILIAACAVLASCIGIKSVSVSNLDPTTETRITARANGIGILHLIVPKCEELEDKLVQELSEQGATKNVRVRLQMRDFLFAVQHYELLGSAER